MDAVVLLHHGVEHSRETRGFTGTNVEVEVGDNSFANAVFERKEVGSWFGAFLQVSNYSLTTFCRWRNVHFLSVDSGARHDESCIREVFKFWRYLCTCYLFTQVHSTPSTTPSGLTFNQ